MDQSRSIRSIRSRASSIGVGSAITVLAVGARRRPPGGHAGGHAGAVAHVRTSPAAH